MFVCSLYPAGTAEDEPALSSSTAPPPPTSSDVPTLHEVILAEKMDFEAKRVRNTRRKKWLQSNQQLLRTLLSYSVLHLGACGGGLASVRMELILLLQVRKSLKLYFFIAAQIAQVAQPIWIVLAG